MEMSLRTTRTHAGGSGEWLGPIPAQEKFSERGQHDTMQAACASCFVILVCLVCLCLTSTSSPLGPWCRGLSSDQIAFDKIENTLQLLVSWKSQQEKIVSGLQQKVVQLEAQNQELRQSLNDAMRTSQ